MKQCLKLEFKNIFYFFTCNGSKRDNFTKNSKETFSVKQNNKTYSFEIYEDEISKNGIASSAGIYVDTIQFDEFNRDKLKREFIYLANNPDWFHQYGIEFTGNIVFNEELSNQLIKDI